MELYSDDEYRSLLYHYSGRRGFYITISRIAFGRKDVDIGNYFLHGSLDEVRIYDKALPPDEIATLKSLWTIVTDVENGIDADFSLYPNPSKGAIRIVGLENIKNVEARDMTGRKIRASYGYEEGLTFYAELDTSPGIIFVKIETTDQVYYRKILIH